VRPHATDGSGVSVRGYSQFVPLMWRGYSLCVPLMCACVRACIEHAWSAGLGARARVRECVDPGITRDRDKRAVRLPMMDGASVVRDELQTKFGHKILEAV